MAPINFLAALFRIDLIRWRYKYRIVKSNPIFYTILLNLAFNQRCCCVATFSLHLFLPLQNIALACKVAGKDGLRDAVI